MNQQQRGPIHPGGNIYHDEPGVTAHIEADPVRGMQGGFTQCTPASRAAVMKAHRRVCGPIFFLQPRAPPCSRVIKSHTQDVIAWNAGTTPPTSVWA
jgi:hypothetical protein